MKYILLYKDGTKRETTSGGGLRVIVPTEHEDGHWTETTFEAGDCTKDVMVYVEGETRDITDDMRRARERIDDNRRRLIERALRSSGCKIKRCDCPCHLETDN